jgi:hypothetical protein
MQMIHTAYPINFDYSDESSFHSLSSQSLFAFDVDQWCAGDYEMHAPHDTLPSSDGLDAFGTITDPNNDLFFSEEVSSDVITDEEVVSTPPPSSPLPDSPLDPMYVRDSDYAVKQENPTFFKQEPEVFHSRGLTPHHLQQHQLFYQYHQLQLQVLQQKLLLSRLQMPPVPSLVSPVPHRQETPVPIPRNVPAPLEGYSYEISKAYDEPLSTMQGYSSPTSVKLTNLDATHFGTNSAPYPRLKSIPVDISGNLSDAQYNKIFKKYHLHLQLESHPTMTEQDLEDIKIHGKMYFLKNVKTIVPKIGPWKFNAHISHRRSDERQYNIPGMAVTCKVKEWLTDDGLWRLYHYKKGKTVKPKKFSDY